MVNAKNKIIKLYEILFTLLICAEIGHFGNTALEYGILMLMFLCLLFDIFGRGKEIFKIRKVQWEYFGYICFFTFWALISICWEYSFRGYREAIFPLIKALFTAIYIFYFSSDLEKAERLVDCYIFGAVYMSVRIIAFIPSLGGFRYNMENALTRPATGLQSNTVGQIAAFSLIVIYFLYRQNKNKKYVLYSVLFFVTIFVSGSRKSMLIPIISLLLLCLLENKRKISKRLIITGIITMATALIIGLYLLRSNSELYNRMYQMFRGLLSGESDDGSYLVRMFLIEKAKYLFALKPICGWGLNSFAYYDYGTIRNVNLVGRYAHNNYWELLSCLGIVGLILYYIRYVYALQALFKRKKKCPYYSLVVCFLIVLIIFEYAIVSYYIVSVQAILNLMIALIGSKGDSCSSAHK